MGTWKGVDRKSTGPFQEAYMYIKISKKLIKDEMKMVASSQNENEAWWRFVDYNQHRELFGDLSDVLVFSQCLPSIN